VGKAVIKVTIAGTTAVAVVRDNKGNAQPIGMKNAVTLIKGQVFDLRASGLEPHQTADIWMYSSPVFLGRATANAEGNLRTSFLVPEELVKGDHHVVLAVKTKSGSDLSVAFAAKVVDKAATSSLTMSSMISFAIAALLIALALIRRRRSTAQR
jgi:hypothetical protein